MRCLYPITIKDAIWKQRQVPCGHCIPCRINKTAQWNIRLQYELQDWIYSSFVTLTYNDDNLPKDMSLHKEHLQAFIKRLRYYYPDDFKYYSVGEYGELELKYCHPLDSELCRLGKIKYHGRPHYHLIIFGMKPFDDVSKNAVWESWKQCDKELIFNDEHKSVANAEYDSINYVTDYVQKKQYSVNGFKEYGNSMPPFAIMSKGLGLHGFMQDMESVKRQGFINLHGIKFPIPRYFCDKFGIQSSMNIGDDVYRQFCIDYGLVEKANLESLDKLSTLHHINWYQQQIFEKYPEHLSEIQKNLRIRNNLRSDKEL